MELTSPLFPESVTRREGWALLVSYRSQSWREASPRSAVTLCGSLRKAGRGSGLSGCLVPVLVMALPQGLPLLLSLSKEWRRISGSSAPITTSQNKKNKDGRQEFLGVKKGTSLLQKFLEQP